MKAAALSGKAFGRMQKGDYRNAAIMLRKICSDKPDLENIEYLYYCLGKCHHHLGQVTTALKWLSKSHDMYKKGVKKNTNQKYLSAYRDTTELYCKVLRIEGNSDLADSITTKLDWS